jgi:microcystin degradation protein MlrC
LSQLYGAVLRKAYSIGIRYKFPNPWNMPRAFETKFFAGKTARLACRFAASLTPKDPPFAIQNDSRTVLAEGGVELRPTIGRPGPKAILVIADE